MVRLGGRRGLAPTYEPPPRPRLTCASTSPELRCEWPDVEASEGLDPLGDRCGTSRWRQVSVPATPRGPSSWRRTPAYSRGRFCPRSAGWVSRNARHPRGSAPEPQPSSEIRGGSVTRRDLLGRAPGPLPENLRPGRACPTEEIPPTTASTARQAAATASRPGPNGPGR